VLARTSTMHTIEREAIWTAWRQPANGADLRFGTGPVPVALSWCQLPHRRRTRRQACSSVTSGSRLRQSVWRSEMPKLCPETGRGGESRVGSKRLGAVFGGRCATVRSVLDRTGLNCVTYS
jgi:hypothetical protein